MFEDLKLFRQSVKGINHIINDNITIHHATLGEICDFGEQKYFNIVSALTCSPSSYKVALWDMGLDWSQVEDWQFFIMMCQNLPIDSTRILLGDLDLSALIVAQNNQTNETVLAREVDGELQVIIDRAIYSLLTDYIRKIHGFEKKVDKPADEHTKKYLIERERKRLERHKNDVQKSMLKPLITSLVNQPGFKYDYSTVWNLPISALNESVNRIKKYLDYTQTMQGVYNGCIDLKKSNINIEEIHWLN